MSNEAVVQLRELLSLETAPARALTVEHRQAVANLLEGAVELEPLRAVAESAVQDLQPAVPHLRAQYAVAMCQELAGETENAGRAYLHLARQLALAADWEGVRELALRALPLWPDYRVVRILLEAWEHLQDAQRMEEDLARAEALCPGSPDLAWRASQAADREGRVAEAEDLACEALARFVAVKEPEQAEEPLLRVLESREPAVYRRLLGILPRMASAGSAGLLNTTLELAWDGLARMGLMGELAKTLERILLKRRALEPTLRPKYVRALAQSLGDTQSIRAFIDGCQLADPDTPLEEALERFRAMFSLRPGAFVEHANLGVGQIKAHEGAFLVIDFADKPAHRMALEIATRSLRPLPEGCLRAARFAEPQTIAHEMVADPVALVVRALTELGGTASARQLRDCLVESTVPAEEWSSWWKRAREAAHGDPRIDTSHAFQQVYRLAGEQEEDEVALPPLPKKASAQAATSLIERFLRQHPELEERARAVYSDDLVSRALGGPPADGVTAVPLLMRWIPDRTEQWTAIARAAFTREPGVAAGLTAEQQQKLLDLGLSGDMWQEAALTALGSRFPAVREQALSALRTRLGEQLRPTLQEVLLSATQWPATALALVRLALRGHLDELLMPWELLLGVVGIIAADPPAKLREAAVELLDPQEALAERLRQRPPEPVVREALTRAARQLLASATGLEPLLFLLDEVGHTHLAADLRQHAQPTPVDPLAIHFDPAVTLMTRATYEANTQKIQDLQRELATTIPQEIAAARALGDLAENAEYHAARERQAIADATLRSLQAQMANARVIEDLTLPEGVVTVGTEVTVRNCADGSEHTYWILGQGDTVQGRQVINYRAPLGQSLIGKRPGDVVQFEGNGEGTLQVVSVTRKLP